ncbi:MAG: amylo-alpha-1,6-glucosidase [Lachnospiraceae bacterium]
MKFKFGKEAWPTLDEGEKNCYLMTNGLGGYHCMSVIGSMARGDQAFLMAAKKAPNVRWHLISGLMETVRIEEELYELTSQKQNRKSSNEGKEFQGYQFLEEFEYDHYPRWTYHVHGITVCKKIVMVHGENTVAVQYEITKPKEMESEAEFSVEPLLRMTPKNTGFDEFRDGGLIKYVDGESPYLEKKGTRLYFATNGTARNYGYEEYMPVYFSQDDRDGRRMYGEVMINHSVSMELNHEREVLVCIYSTKPCEYSEGCFEQYVQEYLSYEQTLLDGAPLKSELGKQLVLAADAYVVNRKSTNGKSIIAGYPFFEDWGRDTMIALPGITMVTGRFEECRSILRTFAKYEKNGLLPNLFPEGKENPMYNSADAPLLFINTVYEYLKFTKDLEFVQELFPVMQRIVEAYQLGTDFHIGMDCDGLIRAGKGLEQLTWMDVRVGKHLPTPRHGKPVEINAYWYSALCVMAEFADRLAEKETKPQQESEYRDLSTGYAELAGRVKKSFTEQFWNEEEDCLKDVLSGNYEERQVRCNQIWALTQPFTMLSAEQEGKVLKKVRSELYTTIGLRTLSPKDKDFHDIYIGPMEQRDRAYHQGTVWAFPLGAYYRACMRYSKTQETAEKEEWMAHVSAGMEALNDWLSEGCLGQIAEIYDGGKPTVSRGCFAQAWSVGELLRAVYEWENP